MNVSVGDTNVSNSNEKTSIINGPWSKLRVSYLLLFAVLCFTYFCA